MITSIQIEKEEIDSMNIILNKLETTRQMIKTIPLNIDQETMNKYVNSVITARGESLWLEQKWWNMIIEKYNISERNISLDFENSALIVHRGKND